MIKVFVTIAFMLGNFLTYSQRVICEESRFKGVFFYEFSGNLYMEDDMIYRTPSFIKYSNDSVNYDSGLFLFESSFGFTKECINETNKNKIKYFSTMLNDSFTQIFHKQETTTRVIDDSEYKIFNISFSAIFLGYKEMRIRKNKRFIKKVVPCYLIVEFLTIDSI